MQLRRERSGGPQKIGRGQALILIDTTVWVGAADKKDNCFPTAKPVVEKLLKGELPYALTTDYVLNETVTILGKRPGITAKQAKDIALAILSSGRVEVIFIDDFLLKDALEIYPRYDGKLSLTDAVSVHIMEKYGINRVFTHDGDFDKVKGIARTLE